jgi:hypothetical protein
MSSGGEGTALEKPIDRHNAALPGGAHARARHVARTTALRLLPVVRATVRDGACCPGTERIDSLRVPHPVFQAFREQRALASI